MICIAIFSFLFILFTFSSYIYHFSELNPTCVYNFCLQALKDLSFSLSSSNYRNIFYRNCPDWLKLCEHSGKIPFHFHTGSGQYYLLVFFHLPAKWANSFVLPEKWVYQYYLCMCTNLLGELSYLFFLLTVLVCIKIFSPVIIISPPSGLNRE